MRREYILRLGLMTIYMLALYIPCIFYVQAIMLPDTLPYVIALFVRAVLYGLYIATLLVCLRWLILDDRQLHLRRHIDRRLLTITIIILVFLTTNVGIVFRITIDLIRGNSSSTTLTIAKIDLENVSILVTNAILIYRCWIMYRKTHQWFIICLPILLWFSSLVCSNLIVYYYVTFLSANPDVPVVFARLVPSSRRCWLVFYLCDVVVNVYATGGIIYQINRASTRRSGSDSDTSSSIFSEQLSKTCRILSILSPNMMR
ncbi:hypothetical protein M378DRAFT_863734 [Amanita muscaria Koide BX008]|uniref:Uncharacterized protein n=1 Tax=Amanita muscaria (strain Koide BX008) TaxID=946122 RepID=A0A0C2T3W7_AMAMK|nr:hypothetical protein M378DRAFT_863734 [Amanita muscaria Koide BX008]